jgi:hypothetical protein
MLQMLSLDVADICCWVSQTLFFNVADVAFRCLQTCGVGCCVKEKGEEAHDVGCCTQHGSQHGRNIVATWSQHGEERRKTPDIGCSQHFHNTFATFS